MKKLQMLVVCALVIALTGGNAFAVTTPAVVTAYVSQAAATLTLTPSAIAFGTNAAPIAGNATTYRYKQTVPAGTVSVSYYPNGPYEIRVFTDNGVGTVAGSFPANKEDPKRRGFIRTANTVAAYRLYLKIWCPNFNANSGISAANGPTLHATTSYTDYLWKGVDLNGNTVLDEKLTSGAFSEATLQEDLNGNGNITDTLTASATNPIGEGASFVSIKEQETMQSNGETDDEVYSRCVLCASTVTRGKELGNPFPVILAVDLTGVKAAVDPNPYSSNNNGPMGVDGGPTTGTQGVIFELYIY